ncbi:MAG: ABC transporter substrate-binding protein [Elusimicrobia bacterium]|nr:ABC transporter substrate-binding protein [Elusimicrobiota bacterium]
MKLARLSKVFLASILCLSAACGARKPDSGGKIVLRYLDEPDVAGTAKEIIRKFEEANPGIRVEMVEGPSATNTREDLYATSFLSGQDTYDVVFMDIAWLAKFAGQNWLRPLDDFFTPQMRSEFLPGDIQGSQYQGKIYRLPAFSDGGMLYYRKDLLQKAGFAPPETFSDLVRIARKIQDPPKLWGFVFQGAQYEGLVCDVLECIWGNGGDLLAADGTVKLDSPEAIGAVRWMVEAIHKNKISPPGVLTYQEEESRHLFQEGKAVFMRNWPYAWELLQKDGSPVKGKVGITPMVHGRGKKSAATLGGWGFGISSLSRHPEAAWKFIHFAASPEIQKLRYFRTGRIPSRKSLYRDPEIIKASPHITALYKVLLAARPRPVNASYARISDTVQLYVSAALSQRETPEKAMQSAAKEIREFLSRQQ